LSQLFYFTYKVLLFQHQNVDTVFQHGIEILELYGFHQRRSMTKYMECNFSERRNIYFLEMKVDHIIIPQSTQLKYIELIIQNNRELKEYVNH